MANIFYDHIIDFKQYDINLNDNIFEKILESRKNELDSNQFFLRYISTEALSKYNFDTIDSLNEFRDACCSYMCPIKDMAGCNLQLDRIVISDPNKKVLGQFYVSDDSITYSPIFPYFYEERDFIKFANDEYFTTISFEELVMNQINYAKRFYVHIRNSNSMKEFRKYGNYIMDEIDKNQMINYLIDPKQGEKILKKHLTK